MIACEPALCTAPGPQVRSCPLRPAPSWDPGDLDLACARTFFSCRIRRSGGWAVHLAIQAQRLSGSNPTALPMEHRWGVQKGLTSTADCGRLDMFVGRVGQSLLRRWVRMAWVLRRFG